MGEKKATSASAASRRDRRKMTRIQDKLYSILHRFYSKMGESQLTEAQVADLYSECEWNWKYICKKHSLKKEAYSMFANEVSAMVEMKRKKNQEKAADCE